jgi:hypothetical protein
MAAVDVAVVLKLIDELSGPARTVSKSLREVVAASKSLISMSGKTGAAATSISEQFLAAAKSAQDATKSISAMTSDVGALAARLNTASVEISSLGNSMRTTFATMTTDTSAAAAEVGALAAEWRGVATAATAAARATRTAAAASIVAPGAGRPGGRGPHGPRGAHVSSLGVPLPGGVHARFRPGGNAAMAGAGALAYGIYEQAELEDSIFQMKWHAGLPNTAENNKYFRDLIQSTASLTGYGYKEIAEAATDEIRLLKGAEGKESGGLAILPEMLRAAATEAKVKPGTTLQGAMRSLVEMAHMSQEYGAEDIKGMAPLLAFLSTTNPATMPQMTRAASYAMPTLHSALNMIPADILYETTAIARAGATNTKSGTWVRAAFERALPPDENVTGDKEYSKRIYAMRKLGLVDKNDKSTILDATGTHIDIDKFLRVERENADKLGIVERNALEKKAFGEQGSRGLDLMKSPAVMAQTEELKREFPEFKIRYETFFEDYSKESPVQKARESWQDLTNVLSDIGSIALPPLLVGLRGFDDLLKTIGANFPKQGETFGPPAKATLGEALGRGMAEGAVVTAPIAGIMALTGVGALPALTAEAIGALIGGTYEGGKFLLGGKPFSLISSAHADELPSRLLAPAQPSQVMKESGINIRSLIQIPSMPEWSPKLGGAPSAFLDSAKATIGNQTPGLEPEKGAEAGKAWGEAFLEQLRGLISGATIDGPKVSQPGPSFEERFRGDGDKGGDVHISGGLTFNVNGNADPQRVADAVHDRFKRAIRNQLSDGQYRVA